LEDELSYKIIGAAIEVHRCLGGPGLLERIYQTALSHELSLMGLTVERHVSVPVIYKGITVNDPLQLDLVVNRKVIIEVKATDREHSVYQAQLLTYLRLTDLKLGLLINFGREYVRDGINRVVNTL